MIDKTLGHYEITDLLGKGGMGEVYRARDTKLKRDVALKVLPADLASDPARLERFQREAETVAGLSHPNIVTLFSVEEVQGIRFLTMELVEGQGLDQVLTPDGLSLPKVFEIGTAVADALAAAHEKGIVHRDLKPANVMITRDGHVKVLDFGLAKLAEDKGLPQGSATEALPITAEGSILGTVPYMSPEQLRGQEVDHRSDIFSLGILIYELATGRRPFGGATNADVTSSILKETPPVLTQLKPDLPRHLGRIVAHCLEKESKDRYHSAVDIRNELRGLRREVESGVSQATGPVSAVHEAPRNSRTGLWIGIAAIVLVVAGLAFFLGRGERTQQAELAEPAPAVDDKSIAVMAFADMSPGKDQEYFSDGIAEELLNLLAKIPELKVISRSSAFSYKGKDVPLRQIGEELGVAHILEGSVRKAGNQIRITAQLIRVESDAHLWSETYDRAFDDVFAIQDDIAATVVEQLRLTLLGEIPTAEKVDAEAYALWLQAVQQFRRGSTEGVEQAIALLKQSLEIDSKFARAWSTLGACHVSQANRRDAARAEALALARRTLETAVALDPNESRAHSQLGWIAVMHDGDLAAAAQHFALAVQIEPTYPPILGNASGLLDQLGRLEESVRLQEHVVSLDPLNPISQLNLGITYCYVGDWQGALASIRTAQRLSPEMTRIHNLLGQALLLSGDPETALTEFALDEDEEGRIKGTAMAMQALGRQEEFAAKLQELIERWGDEWPSEVAHVYAFVGDADAAFAWLDKSIAAEEEGGFDTNDPFLNSLHDDPRWVPLLKRIGRAPEDLAKIEFELTLPKSSS